MGDGLGGVGECGGWDARGIVNGESTVKTLRGLSTNYTSGCTAQIGGGETMEVVRRVIEGAVGFARGVRVFWRA
eukprot:577782-Pyramimonas_sp.AAC.2